MVHCTGKAWSMRIDSRAIYSAGAATDADFRLGGFEFCLRVAELDKAPLQIIAKSRPWGSVTFSFLDDWRSLGRVIADLAGLDLKKLDDDGNRFAEGRPKLDLRAVEIDLVRLLVQPERNRALDAQIVSSRVDAVVKELEAEALADNSRYVLALRLGQTSRLSAALNAASGDAFDTDDIEAQLAFVQGDLEIGATLVRTNRGDLFLATETLVYDLKPLRNAEVSETWNVASCDHGHPRDEVRLGRRDSVAIPAHRIEIMRFEIGRAHV